MNQVSEIKNIDSNKQNQPKSTEYKYFIFNNHTYNYFGREIIHIITIFR